MRYLALGLLAAFLVGCYETPVPLGRADEAKMDRAFVGNWHGGDQTLIIRNLDDRQYYVEYCDERAKPGEKTLRMVGELYPIGNARFAQLRQLPEDGSIAKEHLILRIFWKDGQLGLQQLKDDFFKSQEVGTSQQLRSVLESNINNSDMYDGEPVLFSRVTPKEPSTATSGPAQ